MAKVKITGHASGTGVFTLTAPNSNTDRTITLPDADVTLGTDATKLPLAGGTMTGNISFGDNNQIRMGGANDLAIFHDGSDSIINEEGTGRLLVMSNGAGINLQKGTSEALAKFITDGAVELYHNNAKKIETSATGVTVTGAIGGATNLGKVLQVVSYIIDDSSAISTSSSSLVSTSVTLNITPSATSSKILILFNVGECYGASDWSLYRGSSAVSSMGGGNLSGIARTLTSNYIDSPSSTSAVTYTIYHKSNSGAAYLKNNSPNTVSLIAMEIGA